MHLPCKLRSTLADVKVLSKKNLIELSSIRATISTFFVNPVAYVKCYVWFVTTDFSPFKRFVSSLTELQLKLQPQCCSACNSVLLCTDRLVQFWSGPVLLWAVCFWYGFTWRPALASQIWPGTAVGSRSAEWRMEGRQTHLQKYSCLCVTDGCDQKMAT